MLNKITLSSESLLDQIQKYNLIKFNLSSKSLISYSNQIRKSNKRQKRSLQLEKIKSKPLSLIRSMLSNDKMSLQLHQNDKKKAFYRNTRRIERIESLKKFELNEKLVLIEMMKCDLRTI